jgi:hypothetical protein
VRADAEGTLLDLGTLSDRRREHVLQLLEQPALGAGAHQPTIDFTGSPSWKTIRVGIDSTA